MDEAVLDQQSGLNNFAYQVRMTSDRQTKI